jgi:aryl-alcohol dehydrogenase-like predicted oxidoreductase
MPEYEWLRERFEGDEGRAQIEKVKRLTAVARDLGCTTAQLALAWCLKNPNVSTVITGASKPSQVVENLKSLDVVPKLTDSVMQRIEQILDNRPKSPSDYRD